MNERSHKLRIIITLVLILFLAAYFRLRELDTNPPSVFRDEAEKGYTAWSLSRTGGYLYFEGYPDAAKLAFKKWPLFVNVLGVTTSATYQYATLPFMAVWGLNEWTLRLPAALAGILTVLLVYFLVRSWTRDETAALLSVAFVAFSPWHVLFSRWALQGIFEPLFLTGGILLFHIGIKRKPYYLLFSALIFSLAFYTYAPARIFVPLLLICLALIYRKELWEKRNISLAAAFLLLLIMIPTFLYYITGGRAARFERLSVFGAHNSFRAILIFLHNYIRHYDPGFLFTHGDGELRHSLLGMGQMYLFEAPLLLYGLWRLVRERTRFHTLLLCWFFLFPVAASLTREGIPHALRSIVALPMPQIVCGLAAASLYRKLRDYVSKKDPRKSRAVKLLVFLIVLVMGLNVLRMHNNLFLKYPSDSYRNWQYGLKQALNILKQEGAKPEQIFISGYITYAPYLVMFYEKPDPRKLKEEGLSTLGYQFLPPGLPINQLWGNIPQGSRMVLYPGEIQGRKPWRTIKQPPPFEKSMAPMKSALEIYRKNYSKDEEL